MRHAVFGVVFLAGLLVGTLAIHRPGQMAFAQPALERGKDTMLVTNVPLAGGGQQIVILETEARSLACYHVKGDTGEIELKSVRNVRWDLQMDEFNGVAPRPKEIREQLNQR